MMTREKRGKMEKMEKMKKKMKKALSARGNHRRCELVRAFGGTNDYDYAM